MSTAKITGRLLTAGQIITCDNYPQEFADDLNYQTTSGILIEMSDDDVRAAGSLLYQDIEIRPVPPAVPSLCRECSDRAGEHWRRWAELQLGDTPAVRAATDQDLRRKMTELLRAAALLHPRELAQAVEHFAPSAPRVYYADAAGDDLWGQILGLERDGCQIFDQHGGDIRESGGIRRQDTAGLALEVTGEGVQRIGWLRVESPHA